MSQRGPDLHDRLPFDPNTSVTASALTTAASSHALKPALLQRWPQRLALDRHYARLR